MIGGHMKSLLLAAVALLVPVSAAAQLVPVTAAAQSNDAPPTFSTAEEIALARSAAPTSVSGEATILVLRNNKYETAYTGSNGVKCFVSRSWPLSIEPVCYDPEAARTILPLEVQRIEMRLAGASSEEIELRVAELIGSGEISLPQRPAMAFMMSAGQVLYADEETPVGSWYPHVHLYMPYATAEQFGGLDPSVPTAFVDDEGKPTANLVVVVREFVELEN
jgi:hypothetical protein